ncbi:MAG: MBL fold metallo-hydrolase [Gemmatimonadetes bacterium]|nr:MBL fold metallo-hydrolase [Gemmatimonadota bacterium]
MLELGGIRVVTDPNWDAALGGLLPRVSAPGLAIEALPRLDAMLLTHAHADHLSFRSLDQLPQDIPLYAPPAVARWLWQRGYTHAVPIVPGETVTIGNVRLTAAAARHLGARYGVDRWRSAANMYLLDTNALSTLFAGDTALTNDTHRIVEEQLHQADRRLDLALLPIGHAPWWKRTSFRRGHLTAEDALTLFDRLDARLFVPYHWGTFHHVTSRAHDAIDALRGILPAFHRRDDVRILEPGHVLEVNTT